VIIGAVVPLGHALPSQAREIGGLDAVAVFNEAFAHEKFPLGIFYQVGHHTEDTGSGAANVAQPGAAAGSQ